MISSRTGRARPADAIIDDIFLYICAVRLSRLPNGLRMLGQAIQPLIIRGIPAELRSVGQARGEMPGNFRSAQGAIEEGNLVDLPFEARGAVLAAADQE